MSWTLRKVSGDKTAFAVRYISRRNKIPQGFLKSHILRQTRRPVDPWRRPSWSSTNLSQCLNLIRSRSQHSQPGPLLEQHGDLNTFAEITEAFQWNPLVAMRYQSVRWTEFYKQPQDQHTRKQQPKAGRSKVGLRRCLDMGDKSKKLANTTEGIISPTRAKECGGPGCRSSRVLLDANDSERKDSRYAALRTFPKTVRQIFTKFGSFIGPGFMVGPVSHYSQ